MTYIFVMIALGVGSGSKGAFLDVRTMAFQSATNCETARKVFEKQWGVKYNESSVTCNKQELYE